ncbi:MAG: hypothetical protein M3Q45_08480 [Chloroflexota bacterium]|nr:hypothetical protein [Chloroflexota bacterium]
MSIQIASTTRRIRWQNLGLGLVCALWLALFGFALITLATSLPLAYSRLTTVCAVAPCPVDQLSPEGARHLAEQGLSLQFYAGYSIVLVVIFATVYCALAALIFWLRPHDRMARFVSFVLLVFGVFTTEMVDGLLAIGGFWEWTLPLLTIFGVVGFCNLLYLFPDGRFVPHWTRWLALTWVLIVVVPIVTVFFVPTAVGSYINPDHWSPLFILLLVLTLTGGGIFAQLYRYRVVSNAIQRQQTKWVVYGFIVAVVTNVGLYDVLGLVAPTWTANGTLSRLMIDAFTIAAFTFTASTFAIAVLRYRLWDIDVIIRRTLVYSVLTGLLALIYFGVVLLFQQLFGFLLTGGNEVAIIVSTLIIATLFSPLRQRVQTAIDRRFYRRQYDAEGVLAAFSEVARNEVDFAQLSERLVGVVEETLQPQQVSLWLREPPSK